MHSHIGHRNPEIESKVGTEPLSQILYFSTFILYSKTSLIGSLSHLLLEWHLTSHKSGTLFASLPCVMSDFERLSHSNDKPMPLPVEWTHNPAFDKATIEFKTPGPFVGPKPIISDECTNASDDKKDTSNIQESVSH